ncbi:MAG: deoxyribonuclease V [Pseudomonadota bacterium]|nr:deoxyribonuclease V [Pseudomonadota bacterium]
MRPIVNHQWNLTEQDARKLQSELAPKVIRENRLDEIRFVAGVDVGYAKKNDHLIAAVVILNADTLEVIEVTTAEDRAYFPYIPGLFSFRELPPIISAFSKCNHTPDLVVCDGQGYAHPRRFGLACHLGVIFDVPTIGCAKKRLIGKYDEPDIARSSSSPLFDNSEVIGSVLRTQNNVKPIYVSIGNRISLATACDWILKLSPKYRLPETTRIADQLVKSAINSKPCNNK